MTSIALRTLIALIVVALSAIAGWQLTYLIVLLPFNMPDAVNLFLRFCLAATGNDSLANPDDMEVLALLLYWALSSLLIGALLYLGIWAVCRRRLKTGL
ncbi:hypothetical protein LJ656_30440 [Paraburkholderia sp. MMS20-SJTR3]|uniref:Uncharacterized protein n=1 Tax=Paraburkholderia sejongensis TaxID=2886946 RepID=A0ABS8K405_9BURK|nr:hypothetical protein [Paraburkholderia sp. MMS20-SJTR3]MCC8396899.1 hypothetical protein [Paraburkholderia sp. MMS20-SJTR3]